MEDFQESDAKIGPLLPLQGGSQKSSPQESLSSRLDRVYCADRAKLMFACYRRDDATNPDQYAAAIALVLSEYPRSCVEFVTDPRTGVQLKCNFPPTVKEVREACDAEMTRIKRMSVPTHKFQRAPYVPQSRDPGCWAKVLIGPESPNYERALAWVQQKGRDQRAWRKAKDGVWITFDGYLEIARGPQQSLTWQRPNAEAN